MGHTIENERENDPRTQSIVLTLEQWRDLGALYHALARIFDRPWQLRILHIVDGRPTINVDVWAPEDDFTIYDRAVETLLESMAPSEYENTGRGHSMEPVDGQIQRSFDLDPVQGNGLSS